MTAAKRLVRAATQKRVRSAELVLRFEDDHLILEVPGAAEAVPATGHWPGTLRMPGTALIMFAKGGFPGDHIELSYADRQLHIRGGGAHIKFKGHWEDLSPNRIDVPLDATDYDYLQLSLNYSPAQITSSGFDKQVAAAEERFQKNLDRTYDLFSEYGLSRADLEAAVRSALKKGK